MHSSGLGENICSSFTAIPPNCANPFDPTIDKDASLEKKVQSFFNESKKNKQIEYLIGDATKIVPSLEYEYDLVFIDADKKIT